MRSSGRTLVARALRALMEHHPSLDSQPKLAKAARVGAGTINRLLHEDQAATVDMLDKIAEAAGLQSWQLLVDTFDPKNPPHLPRDQREQQLQDGVEALVRKLLKTAPK